MVTSLIRPTWIWHSLLKYFPPSQLQSQVSCQSKQKLKNILRKDIWRHQTIHSEILSFHIQYWQQHLFLNKKISKVKSRTIYFQLTSGTFYPRCKSCFNWDELFFNWVFDETILHSTATISSSARVGANFLELSLSSELRMHFHQVYRITLCWRREARPHCRQQQTILI